MGEPFIELKFVHFDKLWRCLGQLMSELSDGESIDRRLPWQFEQEEDASTFSKLSAFQQSIATKIKAMYTKYTRLVIKTIAQVPCAISIAYQHLLECSSARDGGQNTESHGNDHENADDTRMVRV